MIENKRKRQKEDDASINNHAKRIKKFLRRSSSLEYLKIP